MAQKTKRRKQVMYITLSGIAAICVATVVFFNQPMFGRLPRGERLERMLKSPNYRNGKFQNLSPSMLMTSEKSTLSNMFNFLRKVEGLRPETDLPTVKTDLKQFRQNGDVMVWLGHSSLFIQTNGSRFLIDPVLVKASPVSFVNKPFKGTKIYTPDDIPDIDFLIITHDHYDHLDYKTVKRIKDRTQKVICPLGVGEHLEYWGFDKDCIIELDWNESAVLNSAMMIHCLPARHFSGRRGLSSDKTLWASFMLQTPSRSIYLSGDSGYDAHFAEIGKRFPDIDLAIMENGQYNENWRFIHMMPEDLVKAIKDLNAEKVFTVHNSMYALGKHRWYEPLDNISRAAERDSLNLITPMIGETVYLNDTMQTFRKWWLNIK
jgi:L-ascorbate metabolism protein UlaG (beta-lactamase superfamily)